MPGEEVGLSDESLALIVAGATALGAAIGGGFVTLRAERKGQEFQRRLVAEERTRVGLTAARLLYAEVGTLRNVVGACVDTRTWPPEHLPTQLWEQQRTALAPLLDGEEWRQIAWTYARVEQRNAMGIGREPYVLGASMAEQDSDVLASLLPDIETTLEMLVKYARGAQPAD